MGSVPVECPCCGARLAVDSATGDVLSAESVRQPGKSFEDAMGEVQQGQRKREDAFSKAFDRTRRLDDLLDKKFEEAKKKAAEEPGKRPPGPFDLD